MKKLLIYFSVLFLVFSAEAPAQNFFDFLKTDPGLSQQGIQCPSCRHINAPGANFCAQCGARLSYGPQTTALSVYCPYCHRAFELSSTNCTSICQNCGQQNASNTAYCTRCGRQLVTTNFLAQCPSCWKTFSVSLSQNSGSTVLCPSCNRWYSSRHSHCTYCDKRHDEDRDDRDHDRRGGKDRDRDRDRDKEKASGSVSLGSFTKSNYQSESQRYQLGGNTSSRSFSKVIIRVHVTQKFAVIVNTIKVRVGGNWVPYNIGSRLTEGVNTFNVSIPQGASEMVISFGHGQGSEVAVSIE